MKTIYSIGRDPGCDIYLYDDRNVISRTHAILKIGKGGKYFISDQSMNGTYVNGIKIAQGVQVPVTRKDVISFAHMAELDWGMVPNPYGKTWLYILISLCSLAAAGAIAWGVMNYIDSQNQSPQGMMPPVPVEDAEAKKQEEEKAKEAKYKEIEEQLKAEQKKRERAEKKAKEMKEEKAKEEKAKEEKQKAEKSKTQEAKDTLTIIY